jgi:hypothetical protein
MNGANIGKISVSSPYRVKKLQYFPRFVPFQCKNIHKVKRFFVIFFLPITA